MSVSVTKAEGVSVFTVTFDPQSGVPPICQIFKSLCCSSVWCSVSKDLRSSLSTNHSVLGALHIMVGLLNIGLGCILLSSGSGSGWTMDDSLFPIWMGPLFIVFGIMSILSEKFPSPCLVTMNVILNVAGVIFALAAIVLYSINLTEMDLTWMCERHDYSDYSHHVTTPSPEEDRILRRCLAGQALALRLLKSVNVVLIVLAVLEFCVAFSCAVLGIKGLKSQEQTTKEINADPELHKPLLEEVTTN